MSSKSPVNGVGYDKSLLAAAPAVSKRDKQEGYDPDLLEQGKPATPAPGRTTPSQPNNVSPSQAKYAGSDESPKANALPIGDRSATTPPTKAGKGGRMKWIIVAVIVLIVVIGVGVGVGVGVGSKRRNNNSGMVTGPDTTGTVPLVTTGGSEPTKTVQGGGSQITKTDTVGSAGETEGTQGTQGTQVPQDPGNSTPRPPSQSSALQDEIKGGVI